MNDVAGQITVFVKYDEKLYPFEIQPRCALHKFITATQNALSIKLTKISLVKSKTTNTFEIPFDVTQYNKLLMEDIGIEVNDTISIDGIPTKSYVPIANEINIYVANKMINDLAMHVRVDILNCRSKTLYQIVASNGAGGNVKLFFNDVEILNDDKLVSSYGLKNNSIIHIESK